MSLSHLPHNTHHRASLQELPAEARRGHSEAVWEYPCTARLEQMGGRDQPALPVAVATTFSGLAAMHPSQLGKCHLVSCKGNSQAASNQRVLCNLPLISSCVSPYNDGWPGGVSNLRDLWAWGLFNLVTIFNGTWQRVWTSLVQLSAYKLHKKEQCNRRDAPNHCPQRKGTKRECTVY